MSRWLGRLMRWVKARVMASVSMRRVSVSIGSGSMAPLCKRRRAKGRWPGSSTHNEPSGVNSGAVRLNSSRRNAGGGNSICWSAGAPFQ